MRVRPGSRSSPWGRLTRPTVSASSPTLPVGTLADRRAAGAAATDAELLVLIDDDVVPEPGALEALLTHAERTPAAAAVGAKILRPDGAVEQVGAVIGRDRLPRRVYAGFPAGHPAVSYSGPVAAVSTSAAVVRRTLVERAGGLAGDQAAHGWEDVDLSLRLAAHGAGARFCHESVSDSRLRPARADARGGGCGTIRARWGATIAPDDLERYERDGLLAVTYFELFPLRFRVSPLLAAPRAERERRRDAGCGYLGELAGACFALERRDARAARRVARCSAGLAARTVGEVGGTGATRRRGRGTVVRGEPRDPAAAPADVVSIFIPVKNGETPSSGGFSRRSGRRTLRPRSRSSRSTRARRTTRSTCSGSSARPSSRSIPTSSTTG